MNFIKNFFSRDGFRHFVLLTRLSFRNLFRQKRRSLLLGAAIGFGMMILVLMNSFAAGLTDLFLNHVLVYVTGHMEIAGTERSTFKGAMIRDKDRIIAVITNESRGLREVKENVSIFARVIGNGRGENLLLVGLTPKALLEDKGVFQVASGNLSDFTNRNTAVMYEEKAKRLKVKVGDTVNCRYQQVQGAFQTSTLKVVAILQNQSFFANMALYTDLGQLKEGMGYKPQETRGLQLFFKNPTSAEPNAAAIHKALRPGVAALEGVFLFMDMQKDLTLFPVKETKLSNLVKELRWITGNPATLSGTNTIFVSDVLAKELHLTLGQDLVFRYNSKFSGPKTIGFRVYGIYDGVRSLPERSALFGEEVFAKNVPMAIPAERKTRLDLDQEEHPLHAHFIPEWNLLPRTKTQQELQAKLTKVSAEKWKGHFLDVRTMYETGSQIIQMESALNLITLYAVLLMFFIILIGVVNTLRMSIRERTREIGTVRAMGMQAADIRAIFVLETVFLALIACVGGFILGVLLMGISHFYVIKTDSPLGLFLLDGRFHFVLKPLSLTLNLILILAITSVTAFFPANRASKLRPADALRVAE
ncbi:MAG: FtsX-like permease family protein [Spirochaetia bacterium]|nr:FtsX-like permease family protein [Spirochaetia bacterium]